MHQFRNKGCIELVVFVLSSLGLFAMSTPHTLPEQYRDDKSDILIRHDPTSKGCIIVTFTNHSGQSVRVDKLLSFMFNIVIKDSKAKRLDAKYIKKVSDVDQDIAKRIVEIENNKSLTVSINLLSGVRKYVEIRGSTETGHIASSYEAFYGYFFSSDKHPYEVYIEYEYNNNLINRYFGERNGATISLYSGRITSNLLKLEK